MELADCLAFGFPPDIKAIDYFLKLSAFLTLIGKLGVELLDFSQHLKQTLFHFLLLFGMLVELFLLVVVF